MTAAVEKEDLESIRKELKDTNKKNTELCVKLTRLFCTLDTLTENQKEHHNSLYKDKTGLETRVQKIENYAAAFGIFGGVITGAFAFKEKIAAWLAG